MTTTDLLENLITAWRAGDALRACAYFGDDAVYQEARHEALTGRDAILEHFVRFFRDGPLWRFEVDTTIVQGERAAVAYRFAVKGDDGRWRERAGCAIIRCERGLIAAWREYDG